MFAALALVATLFEAALGYPAWLFERVGHPVVWIGRLIAWCDSRWNTSHHSKVLRRTLGALTLILVVLVSAGAAFALVAAVTWIFDGLIGGEIVVFCIMALIASTLIAQRSLDAHVVNITEALEHEGVEAGRAAVAQIVGRDTAAMDEAQVSRATIESLAENFSDGVVAPVLWLAVAGLPGAAAYKAINTADSMIGHMTERHHEFGFAAAKVDDVVNLPASRLSAVFLVTAAALHPRTSAVRAFKTALRDAPTHRSPNAGWPEAAMAGALGLALAGPRSYDGDVRIDPWMGDGRSQATSQDIKRARNLFRLACVIEVACLFVLTAVIYGP